MGGQLAVCTCPENSWLTMAGAFLIEDLQCHVCTIQRLFSGLPVEAAIMVKCKEGKISFLCVFCFSSPGFCSVKTRQHPSGFVSKFAFRGSKSVCSQLCNDSVLSALFSFDPQRFSVFFLQPFPISSLCPAAANATILVALTRPYAQPLSQNAASVRNVSAIS